MKGNQPIPNDYTKKDIHKKVKAVFNLRQKKEKRMRLKQEKQKRMWPRPEEGALRPVVRCPGEKNKTRVRTGRGFTVAELLAADINPRRAMKFGISIDKRRKNHSLETLELNKERLMSYMARLVRLTRTEARALKNDESARSTSVALKKEKMELVEEVRMPSAEEREFQAYMTLKKLRGEKHLARVENEAKKIAEQW
uniref:60S ribosomal protein L13 n=1 Tax=Metchnikovella dogieli TaxID=2804710 RepID=A0A896WND0_9MICR|nr:60S ribosomal protein L13 [Metchnikovella dogieli]